jgi:uncharacterized membrane protein
MSDGAPPAAGPRARDALEDRSLLVDTALSPIVFLAVNALAGLNAAAIAALGLAVAVVLTRLVRRQPVTNALGGLVGVGIAVLIALATGSAEGYFLPRVVLNAFWALAFLVSIVARRPAIGIFAQLVHGLPEDWLANPPVRRAFTEATMIWVVYYAGKAIIYGVLIQAGELGALAAVSFVLGWPLFIGLFAATYWFLRRRIERLGGPPPPDPSPAAA